MENEVMKVIRERRSHRAYRPDQIEEEKLSEILEAALASPSATNRQPWHFTAVQEPSLLQKVHECAAAQIFGGDEERKASFRLFYEAPTVLFIFGEKDFPWTGVDCGIAAMSICLAAESLGLGSVMLGLPAPAFQGKDGDELRALLQCPEGYDFVLAISLGYPADEKKAHSVRPGKISRIRPVNG